MPERQTLDVVANNYIARRGYIPAMQTRLMQKIDGETVLILAVVPGMFGSGDLFQSHDGKLFPFSFWPVPSVAAETETDVKVLLGTVTQWFYV